MRLTLRKRAGSRRGGATVEFAIGVPLFFLLVLAMVEMTRAGMAYDLLTLAAREGCRVAVIPDSNGNPQTTAEATVQSILNAGGITSYSKQWTWGSGQTSLAGTHLGDPVTLTISVPFRNISWLPTPLFLKSVTLSASATHCSEIPN